MSLHFCSTSFHFPAFAIFGFGLRKYQPNTPVDSPSETAWTYRESKNHFRNGTRHVNQHICEQRWAHTQFSRGSQASVELVISTSIIACSTQVSDNAHELFKEEKVRRTLLDFDPSLSFTVWASFLPSRFDAGLEKRRCNHHCKQPAASYIVASTTVAEPDLHQGYATSHLVLLPLLLSPILHVSVPSPS